MFKEILSIIRERDLFESLNSSLIRGFKVSFIDGLLSIDSVSFNEIPKNTITKGDIQKLKDALSENPLNSISLISIDTNYDFVLFRSCINTNQTATKIKSCGKFIAIKVYDILGAETMRIVNNENF